MCCRLDTDIMFINTFQANFYNSSTVSVDVKRYGREVQAKSSRIENITNLQMIDDSSCESVKTIF